MDFGTLLHVAQQKTQNNKNEGRYYSTKFEAPKKEERNKSQLSANIKKFLAEREAEERKKAEEARIKKLELLALRAQDSKAKKRVQFMLSRTKSANRSVIQDAVDNKNTLVSLAGASQPDEDDYGYESQESAAIFAKMMERYSAMPEEEKFPSRKRSVSTNLQNTKDRVKAALLKEEEEANAPHKRKRKSKVADDDKSDNYDKESDKYDKYEKYEKNDKGDKKNDKIDNTVKPSKPRKPCPPPLNFSELLKIAEKKQFEPIIIEPKKVEEEVLMTKRQRRDREREQALKDSKEARLRAALTAPQSSKKPKESPSEVKNGFNRIPKLNQEPKKATSIGRIPKVGASNVTENNFKKPEVPNKSSFSNQTMRKPPAKDEKRRVNTEKTQTKPEIKTEKRYLPGDTRYKESADKPTEVRPERRYLPGDTRYKPPPPGEKKKPIEAKGKLPESKPKEFPPANVRRKPEPNSRVSDKPKQFPPADVRPRQFPPADVRPRQFPPADVRPKQFPPPDVRRKGPAPQKIKPRRPIIEDDDSEYDSELDDFIDDGPLGDEDDYSKHIKEIFGYDKSRYRDVDDEDDAAMESKFCTIMKEEQISAKIGLMEDLEDMKKEAEDKKRKELMKKKMRR